MSRTRKKIEEWFESFGHLVYGHRWIAIIIMIAFAGSMGSQLPGITFDTSTESFLHKDDPTILTYNDFRRQFGRDEYIIIAIESSRIFTPDFLEKLKSFHEELENRLPHVDDITSMINARNTRGDRDRLIVGELLEDWPETVDEFNELRLSVLSNKLYLNRLISVDGRFTVVAIKTDTYSGSEDEEDALGGFDDLDAFDKDPEGDEEEPPFLTDEENSKIVDAAKEVIRDFQAPDFKIYLAGSPVILNELKRHMLNDMFTFMRLVLLTIGICLFLMFRRITGVLLPLLIVALSLITTLGLMAIFHVSMTLPTNILPSFLLAVGVGASVHVLAIFYQNLRKGDSREKSICKALGHSGLAIVMTSLTTAGGLASFAAAGLAPIAHLGIFASIGVIIALLNTIVLLPSLLAIIPVRIKHTGRRTGRPPFTDRFLTAISSFSTGHARGITAVSILLIGVSLLGITRLTFSHNIMIWLPEELPIRIATEKIDREMRGTVTLDIIVDTGRENGLYDPDILNRLEMLTNEFENLEMKPMFIGKASSLADILKEIHQALHENRPEYYVVPRDPELIPQEFLLFENSGSDDLEDVVDSQFQKARVTLKVPWADAIGYMPFLIKIEDRLRAVLGDKVEITTTGLLPMLVRTLYAAIHSMAKSYIIAFVVITLMMILLIGNLRLGLISMIPNLLPVILTLGIIGWAGLVFDMFTMLIGSIAIGLAVDDTVHFMYNFRRYYHETGSVHLSVKYTLQTTGKAMLVTSIVLSIGFFIFMFASMTNLYYFGLLTGITIISALLADYLLAPALMVLVNPADTELMEAGND